VDRTARAFERPQTLLAARARAWWLQRYQRVVYIRGNPADYDQWRQLGCTGWSWSDVLPYFRKSENSERGESDLHGAGGPLHTSNRSLPNPLVGTFLEACGQVGIPLIDDFNGPVQEGAAPYDSTTKGGERWSVARGYLEPVMNRPNLNVITNAITQRVLFEGKRAVGVSFARGGHVETIRARREVIVCGGAVNSPQILMLSGVGPAAHVQSHGISVVADAPGVGENLQDHLDVLVRWRCTQPITLNKSAAWYRKPIVLMHWLISKEGADAGYMPTPAGAFLSSRPGLAAPDLQIHFMASQGPAHGAGGLNTEHGFQMHLCPLRPESRGTLSLASADPAAQPKLQPRYLSAPNDMEVMLAGLALVEKIAAAPAFAPFKGERMVPRPHVTTRDQWITAIREEGETLYHPVGTCKMGIDPMAVVDPQLRVNGVSGLRVVDASVMPTLVSGNTNAPTVMIAEKAADMILADAKHALAA
jgi:choline dehydrogenase